MSRNAQDEHLHGNRGCQRQTSKIGSIPWWSYTIYTIKLGRLDENYFSNYVLIRIPSQPMVYARHHCKPTVEMKMRRVQAFRHFGTKPKNPYRSLSARSADGGAVAVTLWKDQFRGPPGRMVYWLPAWGDWNRSNGRSFFEDLEWAVANCDGIVSVVVVVRDQKANLQARTADCYPGQKLGDARHLSRFGGWYVLEQCPPAIVAE
jgi:hypothetical protein